MPHLLLLEPNIFLGRLYERSLTAAGFTVAWRTNGQAAIVSAEERSPDVLVIELLLPGHSGIEFLYELRSYTDWLPVPVLAVTMLPPYQQQAFRAPMAELGVTDILYKPKTSLLQLCSAAVRLVPQAAVSGAAAGDR